MKHYIILLVLLISLMFSCINIKAQEQHGGTPLLFGKTTPKWVKAKDDSIVIESRNYEWIDNEKEQKKADSIAAEYGYGRNKFYGIAIPVNLNLKEKATVFTVNDTGKLYLLELTSPSAYSLQIYFDKFKIPKGGRMFVYDKDKTWFIGSFTHENNFKDNSFSTIPIPGNSIIVEYYEPNEVDIEAQLHIKNLSHVFLPLNYFTKSGERNSYDATSAECHINVNCPLGSIWEREKRSVALILTQTTFGNNPTYSGFCSGALINNTNQDGRPLFLTANHCGDPLQGATSPYIWNWIFLFNFETELCNQDGSNLPYNIPNQSVYGATSLRSDNPGSPTSDFLLLELNTTSATLTSYNAVWAGWDADEFRVQNSPFTIGIHHPAGDVKKISKDNNPPLSYDNVSMSEDCKKIPPPKTTIIDRPYDYYWQVRWDQGITEGGSSGSPLFNSNHQIIGQLYGGCSFCDYPNYPDYYGKLSKSFREGWLSEYLDPYSTGKTSMGSYNPSGKNDHCYNGVKDENEVGTDCGGDCPPCGSLPAHCYNGVKDECESGIDCGCDCGPCGTRCNDCTQNQDEEGIDCGGSCLPCDATCTDNNVKFTSNAIARNIKAQGTIETDTGLGGTIWNGKEVTWQAGEAIILKRGFKAENGSKFQARIAPCSCNLTCGIIYPNVFTPNGDGINDNWCFFVRGYSSYSIEVFNRWGNSIYKVNDRLINGDVACVWDGSSNAAGAYTATITFYSECSGTSKTIKPSVSLLKNKTTITEYEEILVNVPELINESQNVKIYPNPAKTTLTVDYPTKKESAILYVINEAGKVIFVDNMLESTHQIDVSLFLNGMYILKIITDDKVLIKKFVKN